MEKVGEENYFFKLSSYKDKILQLIKSGQLEIIPEKQKNEVIRFLQGDVQDISISRSKERARNWGVQVPGDPTQIMYVWFDALNVYQSGVGFGIDEKRYKKWWPADVHLIGKGIIRFHAVYWPAMLLSAGLPLPKHIYSHGYITVNGQKMSKTLGNVIDPIEIIEKYGVEPIRYYLLREIPTTEDGDISVDRVGEMYSSALANELGNLVSRLAKLCEGSSITTVTIKTFSPAVSHSINRFALREALDDIWNRISAFNKRISDEKVWEKKGDDRLKTLNELVAGIIAVGYDLQPFLPETAKRILSIFTAKTITQPAPLFPRLSA